MVDVEPIYLCNVKQWRCGMLPGPGGCKIGYFSRIRLQLANITTTFLSRLYTKCVYGFHSIDSCATLGIHISIIYKNSAFVTCLILQIIALRFAIAPVRVYSITR